MQSIFIIIYNRNYKSIRFLTSTILNVMINKKLGLLKTQLLGVCHLNCVKAVIPFNFNLRLATRFLIVLAG